MEGAVGERISKNIFKLKLKHFKLHETKQKWSKSLVIFIPHIGQP